MHLALATLILASSPPSRVVFTEIYARPPAARAGAEFVEVANTSTAEADLSGWKLVKGIRFTFPAGFRLAPGAAAVVCADTRAFRVAFGEGPAVAGRFDGRLAGQGEMLRLEDAAGVTVTDVRYSDRAPRPRAAGEDSSLTLVRLRRDPDDPAAWALRAPTPGIAADDPSAPEVLSLYGARHEPASPAPDDRVTVWVRVHAAPKDLKVRLRFEASGAGRSLPMEVVKEGAGGEDATYRAVIPPQRAGTIVRYWAEAVGLGATTPRAAYHVSGPAPPSRLPFYDLVIEPRDLQALLANPFSNEMRPAVFVYRGEVHDVTIRCRGAWARTWPKKSFKLVFPDDHPFRGRKRWNLNSAWRDEAFIREPLAYEIYRDCGAPSIACRMVRLHVNDEFWGLFSEVESPKKRWLAEHGLAGATLLKAASRASIADERDLGSPGAYVGHYTVEAGPEQALEDLARFCAEAASREPARFFEERMDIDAFTAHACGSALVQDWDGYNKNHFLVHDVKGSGKWNVVPWDLDRTLGDHWSWAFDVATVPLYCGTQRFPGTTGWNRLLDRFLGDSGLRKRFHDRMLKALLSTFTEEKLHPRIEALRESIALEADLDRARWGGGNPDWRSAIDQLKRYVSERRAFLLAQLPGGEPAAPRALEPAGGAAVKDFPVRLRVTAFAHETAGVSHRLTRWLVHADGAAPGIFAIDETTEPQADALVLEKGVLLPRTRYTWRAAHVGSNGKTSAWSAEASFTTGDFPFRAVPFDLSKVFNRDLVANPGDRATDDVDDRSGSFLEDGFDGTRSGNPLAQGLPRDRKVGLHVLGDYSKKNALQLTSQDRAPVRVQVPPGKYAFVRLLVAGGGGDSTMPLVLEHEDGSRLERELPCDDWYDDNPPDGPLGSVRNGAVAILNELDRLRDGVFKDRNEPAIFEVRVACDPGHVLRAIVLEPARAAYDKPGRTRFNLFAATGVEVGQ